MKKTPKVTIEKLALMMNSAFQNIITVMNEKFADVDKRFNAVDERFNAMDHRFDAMDKRFDDMDVRFDKLEAVVVTNHENRISRIEDDMRVMKNSKGQ